MRLKGKVAIVTGAATGIGQGIALAFAKEGAKVVVDYFGKPEVSEDTLKQIAGLGGDAIGVDADVSSPTDVASLIKQTVDKYGKLDIIVNNAGIEKKIAFVDFPAEEFQKILTVNLFGTFLGAQAAAKQMIAQGKGGRIINISSVHEDMPMPTNAPYCASKGGIRMLMRTIAVELAPHNITVNNIGPGAVFTPIDKDVETNSKLDDQILDEIPLHCWGTPSDIASMAVFLASDEASYCTGSTHFVDGGMLRMAGSL